MNRGWWLFCCIIPGWNSGWNYGTGYFWLQAKLSHKLAAGKTSNKGKLDYKCWWNEVEIDFGFKPTLWTNMQNTVMYVFMAIRCNLLHRSCASVHIVLHILTHARRYIQLRYILFCLLQMYIVVSICQQLFEWFNNTVPDPDEPTFHPCLRLLASSRAGWKSLLLLVNQGALWPGAVPCWFPWPLIKNTKNG